MYNVKYNYKNKKLTPINDLLNANTIPNRQSKIKISSNDFKIPLFKNYEYIIDNNYNNNQLKDILKYYKLKNTGNKDELKRRCYNYLYLSFNANTIQRIIRGFFIKKYIYYHGPGFINKKLCTNDVDFVNLDDITKIPYSQFFSIKDEDNFVYGFDIQSIYNLYIKNKNIVNNPYSTKLMNKSVYDNMMSFIRYSKLLGIEIETEYNINLNIDCVKNLEMKILNLFQNMDSLGNYTNMSWFNNLNKNELIQFYHELLDIWNYRANLSQNVKREICPPYGNPFKFFNNNNNSNSNSNNNVNSFRNIRNYNFITLKKNIVSVLEEFVYKGIDDSSKSLGSLYILSALTLVSKDAAESMPWLFQSVAYIN